MEEEIKKEVKKEETRKSYQEKLKKLANNKFKSDFDCLLRSQIPLLYIITNEEMRLKEFLSYYSKAFGYKVYIWDIFKGLIDLSSGKSVVPDSILDPINILEHIIKEVEKMESIRFFVEKEEEYEGVIFVLLDYHRFINGDDTPPGIERRLKYIAELESIVTTIVTGPEYQASPPIDNLFSILDFPYLNADEIKNILWLIADGVKDSIPKIYKKTQDKEEDLIRSVSGLTKFEAEAAFSKSLVKKRDWDMKIILEEKKQIIRKNGLLEFYDQKFTVNDVGGLKNVINWLKKRKNCFSEEAKEYGLVTPRGMLAIGMPGCVLGETKIKIKKVKKKGKYKIYKS